MLTNRDIDEVLVLAELDVDENIEDVLREFYLPDVEMEAQMLWEGLPDTVKRVALERHPEIRSMVSGQ